jgi:hypothetical protein
MYILVVLTRAPRLAVAATTEVLGAIREICEIRGSFVSLVTKLQLGNALVSEALLRLKEAEGN